MNTSNEINVVAYIRELFFRSSKVAVVMALIAVDDVISRVCCTACVRASGHAAHVRGVSSSPVSLYTTMLVHVHRDRPTRLADV